MKKKIVWAFGGAVIGAVVTFLLMTLAQYRGCSVKLSVPPSFELNCAGAPHQVAVNFGGRPSRRTLGEALTIIAQSTQSRGPARVWVSEAVLKLPVASVSVAPPAGAQPSLAVVQQLLAEAQAGDAVGICIVPEGGYRVQRLK